MKLLIMLLLITNLNAYVSSDGDEHTIKYNKHSVILTSVNVKHFIENNAGAKEVSKKLKLYLGKDCDAFSDIYGNGTLGWANVGFTIDFDGKSFGFPRQELNVDRVKGIERCQI